MSESDRGGGGGSGEGPPRRPASSPPTTPSGPSRAQIEQMELTAMRGQIAGLRELLADMQHRLDRAEGERVDAALLGRLLAQVATLEGRLAESDAHVRAVEARERDVIDVTRRDAEHSAQAASEAHARAIDALHAEHGRVVDGLRALQVRVVDALRAEHEQALVAARGAGAGEQEGLRRALEAAQAEVANVRRELESTRRELEIVGRGRDAERDRADGFVQRVRAAEGRAEAAERDAEARVRETAQMATRLAEAQAQARAAREKLAALERAAVEGATRLNEIERRELEATRLRARWMASTRRVIEDSGNARRVLSEVAQLFSARDSVRPGAAAPGDPRRPTSRPPPVTVDAQGEPATDGDEPALTLEDDDEGEQGPHR